MICVFCDIVAGRAPASIIYQDDAIMALMTLRPFAPGECIVIPRAHVDHFTDLDDDTAQRIMTLAQRLGRRMRTVFNPQRVGMVVHGYGVAHAHFILVPQHGPYDITSARYAQIEGGTIVFSVNHVPQTPRATLDEHARLLAEP
ncbi:MAG: HIT family protein [bacterium]